MAYVELTKEDWDDVVRAAGLKAGAVVGVVNRCGGFTSSDDAPPGAVAEEEAPAPARSTYPVDEPTSLEQTAPSGYEHRINNDMDEMST